MFKKNASFASAMGLFAKAQAELKLAAEQKYCPRMEVK